AAIARAVSTIVSVPCVTTMARSAALRQRATIAARPSSSMSRLSIIIAVSIARSSRARPRRSISWTWVSLKNSFPDSSSYSLSKVPPVTRILICTLSPQLHVPRSIHKGHHGHKDHEEQLWLCDLRDHGDLRDEPWAVIWVCWPERGRRQTTGSPGAGAPDTPPAGDPRTRAPW